MKSIIEWESIVQDYNDVDWSNCNSNDRKELSTTIMEDMETVFANMAELGKTAEILHDLKLNVQDPSSPEYGQFEDVISQIESSRKLLRGITDQLSNKLTIARSK